MWVWQIGVCEGEHDHSTNQEYFMVDSGGGSAVLHQLKHAGYDWMDMRHIFVTHKHVDHLMGIIWMVRMILNH